MAGRRGESQKIAAEAARRGWSYSPTDNGQFTNRWRWSAKEPGHISGGFHHPFQGPGLGRYDKLTQVLSGTTGASRPFWAFRYVYTFGERNWKFRTVAFIYTGRRLPTVSVVPQAHREPITSWLSQRAARAAKRRNDAGASAIAERLDGLKVGSDEFQRTFLVESADRSAAEWLLTPQIQGRLLADDELSVASKDADVLCWRDPPPTEWQSPTFNLTQVDSMLEFLDAVDLDSTPGSPDQA